MYWRRILRKYRTIYLSQCYLCRHWVRTAVLCWWGKCSVLRITLCNCQLDLIYQTQEQTSKPNLWNIIKPLSYHEVIFERCYAVQWPYHSYLQSFLIYQTLVEVLFLVYWVFLDVIPWHRDAFLPLYTINLFRFLFSSYMRKQTIIYESSFGFEKSHSSSK